MARFSITRRLASIAAVLALAALTACGGSSGDEQDQGTKDVAPTFTASTQQATPIVHEFTTAGTYTLTLTGDYAPAAPQSSDTLNISASFSGQGTVSGGDQAVYTIAAGSQSVKISQTIRVTLEGAGPWEVSILCGTAFASGTMSALTLDTLNTSKH